MKVKNIKSPFTDEKTAGRLETSSTSVDFRTLPKGKYNDIGVMVLLFPDS